MVKTKDKSVKYWTAKIEKAKKSLKEYFDQAQQAADAARDTGDKTNAFNIQWTNTHILRSAIYSSLPKPDVRRRFQKPDQDEKQLAQLVERAIEYSIDSGDFDVPSRMVVRDYVETGLGIPRVIYDVQVVKAPDDPTGGEPTYELGLTQIASQTVSIDHVPWNHFLWEPGKAWKDVGWVAYKSFKPKREVEEEYDLILSGGTEDDGKKRASEDFTNEIILWEIWDRPAKKVYVITPHHKDPLDVYDDPLNLQNFFPSPQPLMGNTKHDELIPKPDYCFIEQQVIELNRLTGRILTLIKQIKDVGFYDKALSETLTTAVEGAQDGQLIPVNNLAATGLGKVGDGIAHLPMVEKIAVVRELEQQRENVKQQIYEIIGISDIVRGASEAQETATAQQIKGQWANVRLSEKSNDVARVWRETFRIFAEIICEHFDPMQLFLMTGIEVTPRMQEIMQHDIGRSFAIDIETDSTIAKDEYENRQQTVAMVTELVGAMEKLIPAAQNGAIPVTVVQEILLMLVNTHKHGKQMEDSIHEIGPHLQGMQQFQQQMQQMQQQLEQQQQQLEHVGGQAQGMSQELSKYNEREEARKDAETRARIAKDAADAEAQRIENQIVSSGLGVEELAANVQQTQLENAKLAKETAFIGIAA